MEWLDTVAALVIGLGIRIGLPILVTILLVRWLRRLDERWQAEARDQRPPAARNIGCWEVNNCAAEQRAGCSAFANPEKPCWQVFRSSDGRMQQRCLGCKIFKEAPVPVSIQS